MKQIARWWAWHRGYLAVFILAVLGSLISGFIPGWGGAINVVCTLVSAFTGFKAGVRYQKEMIG